MKNPPVKRGIATYDTYLDSLLDDAFATIAREYLNEKGEFVTEGIPKEGRWDPETLAILSGLIADESKNPFDL